MSGSSSPPLVWRALDRLAPFLAGGGVLGLCHLGVGWYLHHPMIPSSDALVGFAAGAYLLGMVWMVTAIPWAWGVARLRGSSGVAWGAGAMSWALGSAVWPVVLELAAPLVEHGRVAEGVAMGGAFLGAAVVAGVGALRLRPSPSRLRLGACVAVALGIAAVPPSLGNLHRVGGGVAADLAPLAGTEAPAGAPDVVLVTADTLRADYVSVYDHRAPTTPNLDALAREGVRFDRVVAPSPWTLPSLAALHAGLPVSRTGAGERLHRLRFALRSPLSRRVHTLAERFQDAGYRTAAVVGNPWASPFFGLDQGFARFRNPSIQAESFHMFMEIPLARIAWALTPRQVRGDDRAEGITDIALSWLREDEGAEAPLFLWVHYIDPHAPYEGKPGSSEDNSMRVELGGGVEVTPDGSVVGDRFAAIQEVRAGRLRLTPAEKERLRDLYAAEVQYLDEHVGRLFDALTARDPAPVIAFASDHGEEFWEHGGFEHAHDYYREVTRVPMFLWNPERVPEGEVVETPVGLVDLGKTLLDLAGVERDARRIRDPEAGVSLVVTWEDPGARVPARISENNSFGVRSELVVMGPWRYISRENGVEELYHVGEDPGERRNLVGVEPEVVGKMRRILEERKRGGMEGTMGGDTGRGRGMEEGVLEGLRVLGYVE